MSQQTSASNYDLYKVFLYVAKYKSLTKAAKELCVSQPAVSQSMKQLEANLGVKLTRRTGHGIKLTPEGELIFPYIKKGCDAFSMGEKALQKYLNSEITEKAVSPSPDEGSIIEEKAAVSADCGDKENNAGIKKANIRFVTDCFVTGTQYSHFTGQKLPYRLLEHLPVILTRNDATRDNLNMFLKDNNIVLKPVSEYDTYDEVLERVIKNEGIGCLPYDFVENELKKGNVYVLEFEEAIPERIESTK